MLDLLLNDDGNFSHHLRRLARPDVAQPDVSQWLNYWNDADSIAGNLRKLEHWLQRAQAETSGPITE